jgi:hypothetical protein
MDFWVMGGAKVESGKAGRRKLAFGGLKSPYVLTQLADGQWSNPVWLTRVG